jgi:hypothetical protein
MSGRGRESPAEMTFTRVLIPAALSACLFLAVPATASDHGGAPADPLAQDASGGGILAPAEVEGEAVAEAAAAQAPRAAQDETPTTPGGEEQPPEQEPNGEQPPSEVPGEETPENGGTGGEETGGGTAGGLPRTGFELAALTAIGLGLLLAGGALWPTSSWPPPRDRRSRSTPAPRRAPRRTP